MKKLLALNVIGLAVTLALAALLWNTASSARTATERAAELDAIAREATQIRVNMVEMSDAMRGFLLDTTQEQEWQNKLKADEHLVDRFFRAPERLLKAFDLVGRLHRTRLGERVARWLELGAFDPRGDRASDCLGQRRGVDSDRGVGDAEDAQGGGERIGGRRRGALYQVGRATCRAIGAVGEVDVNAAVADHVIGHDVADDERRDLHGRDDEGGAAVGVHGEDIERRLTLARQPPEPGDVRNVGG